MEATGVYWMPVFQILEERGLAVILVNARQTKNVAGRKSDVQDCQWIQRLHTYGLLQGSFRPEDPLLCFADVSAVSRRVGGRPQHAMPAHAEGAATNECAAGPGIE